MNNVICIEIIIEDILKNKNIPHFKNLINLFPHLLNINIHIDTSVPLFKKSKKNTSYISDLGELKISDKPNHYDIEQYELDTIHIISEKMLFNKSNYNFTNVCTPDFNLVINNIPTIKFNNNNEFNKTIKYYHDLFNKIKNNYTLINNINNNKTIYIRTGEHSNKHSNPNNVFDVSKNDSTLIITDNDTNLELFNHFYNNYMVCYKIITHISCFLIDCKNNNIIPYFLNEPKQEHIFNINDVYYTRFNLYRIKIFNYDDTLCIKQDNILKQPTHIVLSLNEINGKKLYRLQCFNDSQYDNLNTYKKINQRKLSMLLKKCIDDRKAKNLIKQTKNTKQN